MVVLLLLVLLLMPLAACADSHSRQPQPRAVAVVLVQSRRGSELAVVDLVTFTVKRRVPLRSLCLSIDGDPETRIVATAQCGGPDRSVDHACGVFQPDRDRAVSYVELGTPNPLEVAVAGDRAFLVHGFEQAEGVCTSSIDIGGRRLVGTGHLPAPSGRPVRHDDRVIAAQPDAGVAGRQLIVDAVPGTARPLARLSAATVTCLTSCDTTESIFAVSLSGTKGRTRWRIHRIAPGQDETVATVEGIEKGIYSAAVVGDELVLADADGLDMQHPGRTLVFVDAQTLAERRRIRIDGMPAAIAAWRGRTMVFDGVSGDLLMFEANAVTPIRRLDLGGEQLGSGDMVVFDSAGH